MPTIRGDIHPGYFIEVIFLLIDRDVFIFRLLPFHTSVYPSHYKLENKKSESCARVPYFVGIAHFLTPGYKNERISVGIACSFVLYIFVSFQKIQKRANKCWYITTLDFVSIVTSFKKKNKKNFFLLRKGYTEAINAING
jgi:hypothetical protein